MNTADSLLESSQVREELQLEKADLLIANQHQVLYNQLASRVTKIGKLLEDDEETCPCCNLPYVKFNQRAPVYPLMCDLTDLQDLGVAFPLFFRLQKNLILFLVLAFFVAGLPCLIANLLQYDGGKLENGSNSWYVNSSLGGYGKKFKAIPVWQPLLHCIVAMFLLIDTAYFKRLTFREIKEINMLDATPSDFTLMIQGLRKDYDPKELEESLSLRVVRGVDELASPVYSICPVYDIREYMKNIKKLISLHSELHKIQYKLRSSKKEPTKGALCCWKDDYTSMEYYEQKIQEAELLLKHYEENDSEYKPMDKCFVTFNKQSDAAAVLESYSKKRIRNRRRGRFEFEVQRAPEPTDVLWENLCYSKIYRFRSRVGIFIIFSGLICLSYYIIYKIQYFQKGKCDPDSGSNSYAQELRYRSISYSISFTITVINQILAMVIRIMSVGERYESWTALHKSVFLKTYIAMCTNTLIVLFVVDTDIKYVEFLFYSCGLVNDIYLLLVTNAVLTPLTNIFSPIYLWGWYKRWSIKRQSDENGKVPMTQAQANKIWEYPQLDLAQWYADCLKTFTIGLVFAPLFPLSLPITFVAMIIQYWTWKILLLRRHARPQKFGDGMSNLVFKVLGVIALLYLLANLFYQYGLTSDNIYPILGFISACFVYSILPLDGLCKKKNTDNMIEDFYRSKGNDYEEQAVTFFSDYKRANPVTWKEGWKEWGELIENKRGVEERIMRMSIFEPIINQSTQNYVLGNINTISGQNAGISGNMEFGVDIRMGLSNQAMFRTQESPQQVIVNPHRTVHYNAIHHYFTNSSDTNERRSSLRIN